MATIDTRSPTRWLTATWSAIVAVLVMAIVTAYVTYRWSDSRQQMVLSAQLVTQAQAVQTDLIDMETGQRGYLVTHADDYLAPLAAARQRLGRDITSVKTSAAPSAEQAQRTAALERLAAAKVAELDSTILLSKAGKEADAIALVRTNHGKATMDSARDIVSALKERENTLNEQWISSEIAWGQRLWLVLAIGTAIVIAVLLVLRASLLSYAREQRQAMHELNRQMLAIEEQERSAGARSHTGEHGADAR